MELSDYLYEQIAALADQFDAAWRHGRVKKLAYLKWRLNQLGCDVRWNGDGYGILFPKVSGAKGSEVKRSTN